MLKQKSLKIALGVSLFCFFTIMSGLLFWKFGSTSSKAALIKFLSKQQFVRDVVADEVKDTFDDKIQDAEFDDEEVIVPEEVKEKLTGYKNVVLFGIDARDTEFDSDTRSDTIMIISINNDTGAVRMVSLYRDTYLNIIRNDGSSFYSKVNAAYSLGGAKGAISTLNTNLDLNIDDYVVVNFSGLLEIIDLLDGIDIHITELEKSRINKIGSDMEVESGNPFTKVTEAGDVHLDGFQTTAYCRIRDAAFTDEEGNVYHFDFGRTARQRYVMEKLVVKAKSSGISTLIHLTKEIMNLNTADRTVMKTSLKYDEIMDLVPVMIDYNIEASSGFPYTLQTPKIDSDDMVVAEGLACNVMALHEFLFSEEGYSPSIYVKEIDKHIIEYTDIQPHIPVLEQVVN